MKIRLILSFIIFLFVADISIGQEQATYKELRNEAFRLYRAHKYKESSVKYEEAFLTFGGKAYAMDRYNVACSYSLDSNIEKSFFHLLKLKESKLLINNYNDLITDKDFKPLHKDKRWTDLLKTVKVKADKVEMARIEKLKDNLNEMYFKLENDEAKTLEIKKKAGDNTAELEAHLRSIKDWDNYNLMHVKKILDKRGWLGSDKIGQLGNRTLFLVLQRADQKTQKKYLPMMREAVNKGDAKAADLTILVDLISVEKVDN